MLYSSKVLGFQFLLLPRDGRAFLVSRSCAPGILGTQARGNANFMQERRSPEHERIGTLCTVMKLATAGHLKPYGNAKTMSFRSAGTWNSRKIRGTRACGNAKVHRNAHPSLLLPISYCHKITITMGLWVKTITKKLKTLKVNQVQRRFAPPFYRW